MFRIDIGRKLQEGTNVSQPQSKQVECEALLHTLSATDESPWCFVPLGADVVQWQSDAFRWLWKASLPKGRFAATGVDTTNGTAALQDLIASSKAESQISINDRDWSVRMVVVLDNSGPPVGRLIRLSPVNSRSEHGAMILASHDAQRRLTALSPRESEILELVYEGLTNKAIAARTNISQKTVEKHRGRVTRKLHTASLAELIRLVAIARYTAATPSDQVSSDGVD